MSALRKRIIAVPADIALQPAAEVSREHRRHTKAAEDGSCSAQCRENHWRFRRSASLEVSGGSVSNLAVDSNTGNVAAIENGDRVRVWCGSENAQRVLRGHGAAPLSDLAFIADRGTLVTVSRSGTVALWNTSNWTEACRAELDIDRARMHTFLLSSDGLRVASCTVPDAGRLASSMPAGLTKEDTLAALDFASEVRIFDTAGAERLSIPVPCRRKLTWVMGFGEGGQTVCTTAMDYFAGQQLIEVWDTVTGAGITEYALSSETRGGDRFMQVSMCRDASRLVAYRRSRLVLIEAASTPVVRSLDLSGIEITLALFHPDGTQILAACSDGALRTFDFCTPARSEIVPESLSVHRPHPAMMNGNDQPAVRWGALDVSGQLLATAAAQGGITLWRNHVGHTS